MAKSSLDERFAPKQHCFINILHEFMEHNDLVKHLHNSQSSLMFSYRECD